MTTNNRGIVRSQTRLRSFGTTAVCLTLFAAVFSWLGAPDVFDHQRTFARQDGVAAEPQGGLIYFVNTTSDSVIVGACQNGNAGCSLRGAISAANSNPNADEIEISIPATEPSCSASGCSILLTSALPVISTSMSLIGPGADKLTVLKAGGNYRIFSVSGSPVVAFSGLTLRGGSVSGVDGSGGGVRSSGTVSITNCSVSDNTSESGGGGIYNNGTLNITNSTISNNQAIGTAGIGVGGGIENAGILNITNSTIHGNSARNSGGGIINHFGRTLTLTNSTVSRNTGGNSTTGGDGGGVESANGATANVKSSIIALNTSFTSAPDVKGSFASSGFNMIGDRTGSTGLTLATDLSGDPMLDPAGLRNNGGPTSTIALLPASPAIDKGTSIGLTGTLATDQRGTGFPRTIDNPAIANANGGNGTDIGAFERRVKSNSDFDSDGKTDISIFRPSLAEWWVQNSSTFGVVAAQFGASTDRITPGDFTGDGKTDIAFWRPSTGVWFVLRSDDNSFFSFPFGASGDIPRVGDFDGDGKDDPAIFRPSDTNWYISRSSGGTTIRQFGSSGDAPVPADYDGDGKFDVAIYRPSLGQWWVNRSSNGSTFALQFGTSTDKPVTGDFTGDGKSDIAFWRPSTGFWFVLRSEDNSFFSFPFGASSDIPTPGDYDGDAKADAAVFRPSSSIWFINRSTAGVYIQQFGAPTDKPVPSAYVP